MEVKKVLIFPAGTEIAFEIQNALKFSKFVELYAANSVPSHGEFVFKNYIHNELPLVTDPQFIRVFNQIIDENGIDYVYPAHDDVLFYLTRDAAKIHAKVVTSPFHTVDICRSKKKTYEYFKGEDYIPQFYSSVEEVKSFPVFAKPAVGQGSVGAKKIYNKEQLNDVFLDEREYVVCEYLPGAEYTVDCFTDQHGKLRVCHPRIRERIRTGIAVRSTLVPLDEELRRIAEAINARLVFIGAWFFQIKKTQSGQYRLMEISPRIPGTMGVSRNLGINYPMLTLFLLWGYEVGIIDNGLNITLDRAFINRYQTSVKYDRVYLDFDDTVYLGDDVNIPLISFLYQCRNKRIPIILITRHQKDLHKSLEILSISESLFTEIIWIDEKDDKSKYIKGNSIFIDDSFAERKRVSEQLHIPVYDLDMIESLIDWRM